jgi:hypothetical protein
MAKKNVIHLICVTTFLAVAGMMPSCKKDEEVTGTDKELYELATKTSGFVWYKNTSVLLNQSSGSGHPQPLLRTRYNAQAATQLDSLGKIKSDAIFPEGSLIVKELHENGSTLGRYAILYKKSSHSDADANGWVWGYINADGGVAEAASKKVASCSGCHSQTDNIDYMLMNKYFP